MQRYSMNIRLKRLKTNIKALIKKKPISLHKQFIGYPSLKIRSYYISLLKSNNFQLALPGGYLLSQEDSRNILLVLCAGLPRSRNGQITLLQENLADPRL